MIAFLKPAGPGIFLESPQCPQHQCQGDHVRAFGTRGGRAAGALYYLPMDIILRGNTDAVAALIKREAEECLLPYGITTVANHIEPQQVLKALNMMDQKGEMPLRWAWVHRTASTSGKADPVEFYKLIGDFRGMGRKFWP